MKKGITFLLLIFTLYSCTTVKINTTKAENYDKEINSLLVATFFSSFFEKTASPFYEDFSSKLNNNNISTYLFKEKKQVGNDSVILNDRQKILTDIRNSSTENENSHVLIIQDTSTEEIKNYSMSGPSNKKITTKMKGYLLDTKTGEVVWEAEIRLKSGDFGNANQSGKALSTKLIEQLIKDKFLYPNFFIQ